MINAKLPSEFIAIILTRQEMENRVKLLEFGMQCPKKYSRAFIQRMDINFSYQID